MLFSFPLMAAIQEISARIGRVTGIGIAGNIRRHYPRPYLYGIVSLLLIANIFNIGADIGAMGAAAGLIFPGPPALFVVLAGGVSLTMQILIPYTSYVKYLKWLTLALFSYVVTAIILHEPRWEAIRATILARSFPSPRILHRAHRDSGNDHKPLLIFLASVRGGRRRHTSMPRNSRSRKPRNRRPRSSREFGSIPIWEWLSQILWPSLSS